MGTIKNIANEKSPTTLVLHADGVGRDPAFNTLCKGEQKNHCERGFLCSGLCLALLSL
jgi:hypothetical protein